MKKNGFTLLELLVVLAIMGVVIGVVGATLAAGIRVWETARDFNQGETEVLLALETMRKDLRNVFPYYEIPFRVEDSQLTFPGMVQDKRGDPKIGTITYGVPGGRGEFVRTEELAGGGKHWKEILVSGVDELHVSCFALKKGKHNERIWQRLSGVITGIPDRVEIRLTLSESAGGGSWAQTLLLPSGGGVR